MKLYKSILMRTSSNWQKHTWTFFFVLICAFSFASELFALDPHKSINQYGHNIWTRSNGLPANAVNVALRSNDGFLWFGTSAGLFRFDGVNFDEVITNREEGETHETISTLCETKDSSLWIGTLYNGLRRLKNGNITSYGQEEGFSVEGLVVTQILQLFESRDGHFYVATSMGVFMYDGGKFIPIILHPNYISHLAEDAQGRIWITSHTGVRIIENVRSPRIISLTTKDGLPHDVTKFIYMDREANVWIGTNGGIARWKNGTITRYTTADGLASNLVNAIFEDRDGNLWVGTQKGLNRFYKGKWTTYKDSDGLTDNNVLSFTEDREGGLWVCTAYGLNQFKDANLTTYTTYDGLDNDYVSSVIEMPDGSLDFLSNQGSSITQIKNEKIKKYFFPVGPSCLSRDGSLWIGENGMLFHLKNGQVTRYDTTTGLPGKWIFAITEDDESLIIYEDGINIFRFVNGKLKPYLLKNGEPYSSKEFVVCFYQESKNLLWIGTTHWLMKIENGESTTYTTADGLAGKWVNSIYDDQRGNLWITSPQSGLTRYRNGKFTKYNTKIGLFTDELYCVLSDDIGNLWLSSPQGIGCLSIQELDDYAENKITKIHSKVYTVTDGMKTDECFGGWQPVGWKTHDGHIWFATKKGAVMIDPKSFKKNELPPPVLIEKFLIDQHTIPLKPFVNLQPGSHRLEIHYAALSYLLPEKVLFKYKLEGFDREWIDANTRRVAYYTNLPPGDYSFSVIACNNDGLWNETGASFAFTLNPHFYQTNWFYGLIIVITGGMIFGFMRVRLWQHEKKEEALQKRIQEELANIKMLSGLIPICANCKKIRNDNGYWDQLEKYIQSHSEAKFSHGICPDCAKILYPHMNSPEQDSQEEGF